MNFLILSPLSPRTWVPLLGGGSLISWNLMNMRPLPHQRTNQHSPALHIVITMSHCDSEPSSDAAATVSYTLSHSSGDLNGIWAAWGLTALDTPWGRLCDTCAQCVHGVHITGGNWGFLLPLAVFLPLWTILHPHNNRGRFSWE